MMAVLQRTFLNLYVHPLCGLRMFLLAWTLGCLGPTVVLAQKMVTLRDSVGYVYVSPFLASFNDSESPATLDQVLNGEANLGFVPQHYLGMGHSAWAKFSVDNKTTARDQWMVEVALPYHEQLTLYSAYESEWMAESTGSLFSFLERPYRHRNYVFPLEIRPGEKKTFYLRSEYIDRGVLSFPVHLWAPDSFAEADRHSQLFLGAFYGLMGGLLLYNLFLFFSLRDLAYLHYVLLILFAILMYAFQNGLASQYLWPDLGLGWGKPDLVFLALFYVVTTRFVQSFLMTKENAVKVHYALQALIVLWVFILIMGVAGYPGAVRPLARFSVISLILYLVAGLVALRQSFRPARFFLIGWAIPALSGILLNLVDIHVFPSGTASIYHTQASMAVGILLFSLGLADRINLITQEKDAEMFGRREAEFRARSAELEKLAFEKELNIAHEMQMSLMPTDVLRRGGVNVAGQCLPATQVGGDLFHYIHLDNKVGICLADVTGHGMEAAIPVVRFGGLLEAELAAYEQMSHMFESLNVSLNLFGSPRQFVCFTAAELDLKSGRIELGNAGCPGAYHFRCEDASLQEMQVEAYPLGIRSDTQYSTVRTDLRSGDRLVFCSDGIPEAMNESGDLMGFDQTADVIFNACKIEGDSEMVVDFIVRTTRQFIGNAQQNDDITCVVLTVDAQAQWV